MRFFRAFCVTTLIAASVCFATEAMGQVKPSAYSRPYSLTVGAEASAFQSDYFVNNKLGGVGAYFDLNLWHGLGIEGEARWLRFNQFDHIHEDNYLVGPRLKVLHVWRAQPYVKGLIGFSNMDLGPDYFDPSKDDTGRFTTYALGGGVDIKVTRRWSVRAIDFEYQKYPYFGGSTLTPYGGSVGIGYRIF
ncbi:MAG TPA: outer membrane beta-barrel protein [Acidobacteriaceae bacterium]|nr:outer membrane beta-barrel protein [Acidobacteriaceae bacterium]